MIVLNKLNLTPYNLFENFLIKAFHKEATFIPKNFWFKNQHIRNFSFNYVHLINNL
ncbi:hypothetical protein HmCmsJML267_01574 [Escherichia coli]|nr:hypothetical protein HmCmsJML230_02966 [Escherichia coli]GDE26879.1 hypothetical protein HmCmsJML267_01574 [Escherichia coli]